jgi:predicted nucleic acid-binding protein
MITLDTNLVLRLITMDDPAQAAAAADAVARAGRAILQTSVIMETAWVLQSFYGRPADRVADALRQLALAHSVDAPPWVGRLPDAVAAGIEIDDAIHLLTADPAVPFATFDQTLRRRAPRLLAEPKVISP